MDTWMCLSYESEGPTTQCSDSIRVNFINCISKHSISLCPTALIVYQMTISLSHVFASHSLLFQILGHSSPSPLSLSRVSTALVIVMQMSAFSCYYMYIVRCGIIGCYRYHGADFGHDDQWRGSLAAGENPATNIDESLHVGNHSFDFYLSHTLSTT
ncbi:hypothetical protein F5Y16DRAFT_203274 [Xylariaceae sp. FL0255]|nr:hypothetical protein F5Y16DRAFT_203274 [Xylariaceae sp. FL0255]